MYQKKNRKKEIVRRVSVYALMIIALIGALTFLTYKMLGYTLNPNTNELQQTGLVQYDSYPSGAMIAIDNTELRRTKAKNTVLPGPHTFSMTLDEYEPWKKTLDVKSNTVTNLTYVRMIPKKRTTSSVKVFDGARAAYMASAGNFMIAIGQRDKVPFVVFGDLRDTDNEKFTEHTLQTDVLAGYSSLTEGHEFTIIKWDKDARYVLVKHAYRSENGAQAVQWLRLDRSEPEKVVDISAVTGLAIKQAHFVGTNGNELYALQDTGELRYVDLGGSTISAPLITHVESFKLYGTDRLAYVASDGVQKIAGIWKKDWKKPFVIGTFPKETTPVIGLSRYFNKDTVALGVGKKLTLYRGEISDDKTRQTAFLRATKEIVLDDDVRGMSFNNGGRFIVLQHKSVARSYDLERSVLSSAFTMGVSQEITWLDDFHLWNVTSTGSVMIQEFDGENAHRLLPAAAGAGCVALSSNQRYIYGITIHSGKNTLTLSKMNMTNGAVGWFN